MVSVIWAAFHMGSDTVSIDLLLVLGQCCNWACNKHLLASLLKSDCATAEDWDLQGTKGLAGLWSEVCTRMQTAASATPK